MSELVHVGIDVSKQQLDVASSQSRNLNAFANSPDGFQALLKSLPPATQTQVVIESTGVYHFDLLLYLTENNYPVAVVSPGRVRAFAKAMNILAKTDKIDATVLVKFSQRIEGLRFAVIPSEISENCTHWSFADDRSFTSSLRRKITEKPPET